MNIPQVQKQNSFRQFCYFARLKIHRWFKEKDLLEKQEKRLRALINHAYNEVPYYQDLFDSAGVKPQDIKSVKDLKKIPILTKENIRENFPDKIISKEIDRTIHHIRSTTGSTGIPLKVGYDIKAADYGSALHMFSYFECGLKLRDKLVSIMHTGYQPMRNNIFKSLLSKVGILNWENISIYNPVGDILESLRSSRPDVIYTYPSMLLLLSEEIKKQRISEINPHLIITAGESLTDFYKSKISNIFGANIRRLYGAEEFGYMAFECPENSGYHWITDATVIEFVNNGRNVREGEDGEIVITGLFNYFMPLIRYKLGDVGNFTREKCSCGSGFPLINFIEGRKDDFLILPSGKRVSPRVINVIENISGISRYKTIQEAKNKIVVNLVKGDGFSEKTINEIHKHIKGGCLGEDVEVKIKLVEELPLERRGKLRAVVSNVKE